MSGKNRTPCVRNSVFKTSARMIIEFNELTQEEGKLGAPSSVT